MLEDELVETPVANKSDFDCFNNSITAGAGGKACDEVEIVHDRKWNRESSDPVLLIKEIDPVLHADPAISLAQGCCWHSNETYSPMCRRSSESGEIKEGPSPNGYDIGVAADFMELDGLPYFLQKTPIVFAGLSTLQFQGRANKSERVGVFCKIR